ncbi:DUF4199 domain-containing protein [Aquiflexum lacus]|uniref:DUF4199 domain-containing protein n=1 Tax=Aquiflexum lacus TaxID=2483805 RepID=UPI001895D956|nr:DUF4199 domain-containing protein [Aquiflexum lacus]
MEEKISSSEAIKKWGLIYGLIALIVAILSIVFDMSSMGTTATIISSILNIGIAFAIYYLSTKEFRESNNDFLSFGQGFKIVFLVGLIGGAIRAFGTYLYIKFIDNSVLDKILEAQIEAQEKMGTTYDPDAVPGFMKFFQTAEFIGISSFLAAIFGALIIGLIAVSINKKTEDY